MVLRQEAEHPPYYLPPPTLSKVKQWRFIPKDWNSKIRIAGQLRQGCCTLPRLHISRSRSQETSLITHAQKRLLGGQRGIRSRSVLSRFLFSEICLGQQMHAHTWEDPKIYQIWTVNQANQSDWLKGTWKKYVRKVIKTATRVQLSDSLSLSLSLPTCLSTHIVFSPLKIILLVLLLSVFVGILFCKA